MEPTRTTRATRDVMFSKEFDERTVANMEVTLERACAKLPRHRNDHATRKFIAEEIVACARQGDTTLGALSAAAMKALHKLG
jgi:hypothetical protein